MELSEFVNLLTNDNDFEWQISFPIEEFLGTSIVKMIYIHVKKGEEVMNTAFPLQMLGELNEDSLKQLKTLFTNRGEKDGTIN